jgi:MinD-like ATPase involved in chromosome partitioning or flagellar assembly
MSDRHSGSARSSRLSSSVPHAAVRVRMLSTGRWRPPLGPTAMTGRRAPRVIAIGAALPGVGKSVVASNLAVAVAGLGRQVLVVDLDLSAPRQHALFGVEAPGSAERATGIRNVRLWPAAAMLGGAGDARGRGAVIEAIGLLDADVVIVDVGHAQRDDLWTFFSSAERLLVTTGDQAALAATYGFLRAAAGRAHRRHRGDAPAVLARFAGGLVGNVAAAAEEAESFHALARLTREELGIPLTALGCLRKSARVVQSIAAKKPLCARRGIDDEVRAFHQMAELVLAERDGEVDCALDGDAPSAEVPQLPADIGRYQRKHPRFNVDWAATLEHGGDPNAVRVRDVSESGAAIETTLQLQVGDTAVLHFYQLDDQLSVEVVVKNVVASLNRVGLGFVGDGDSVARVVGAARSRLAAS